VVEIIIALGTHRIGTINRFMCMNRHRPFVKATVGRQALRCDIIYPFAFGHVHITTRSKSNVKDSSYSFGNWPSSSVSREKVYFYTMKRGENAFAKQLDDLRGGTKNETKMDHQRSRKASTIGRSCKASTRGRTFRRAYAITSKICRRAK
jgi:hypothetical protein